MDVKKWYQSKTVIALIGLVLIMVNDHFGIVVSENEVFSILEQGTQVLLAIYAIYGRFVAKKTIE